MPKYEAACGRCYAEYELDEKPDNAIFCPNCRKHGGPLVGVLNFEECVDDIVTERDTLRSQLKSSQADVKLLREAASILLGVIDSGKIMRPDCYPIVDMKAALTATAPKGEQGCQSKS